MSQLSSCRSRSSGEDAIVEKMFVLVTLQMVHINVNRIIFFFTDFEYDTRVFSKSLKIQGLDRCMHDHPGEVGHHETEVELLVLEESTVAESELREPCGDWLNVLCGRNELALDKMTISKNVSLSLQLRYKNTHQAGMCERHFPL